MYQVKIVFPMSPNAPTLTSEVNPKHPSDRHYYCAYSLHYLHYITPTTAVLFPEPVHERFTPCRYIVFTTPLPQHTVAAHIGYIHSDKTILRFYYREYKYSRKYLNNRSWQSDFFTEEG